MACLSGGYLYAAPLAYKMEKPLASASAQGDISRAALHRPGPVVTSSFGDSHIDAAAASAGGGAIGGDSCRDEVADGGSPEGVGGGRLLLLELGPLLPGCSCWNWAPCCPAAPAEIGPPAARLLLLELGPLLPGQRVVLVDNVLASGATMQAALGLLRKADVTCLCIAAVAELTGHGARGRLERGAGEGRGVLRNEGRTVPEGSLKQGDPSFVLSADQSVESISVPYRETYAAIPVPAPVPEGYL